uniref:Fibronectin type-III domain-containing protein n=1 Tax=Amphimedon queenslandica TaxID=400682 RepID=A0A1X7TT06_AMPQE
MTAPLYTSVSFQCIGTGDALAWLIEGVSITDLVKQERNLTISNNNSNSTLSSVLTINTLPTNDGIHIGCIIISFNPHDAVLAEVVLTIQGVTSIEDLTLNFTMDNYFFISWLPPIYYSNDVSAASLVYNVLVVNSNHALILNETVFNTSVELANITECDTYNVNVTAFVAQYKSVTTTASGKNEIQSCLIDDEKIVYFSRSISAVLIQYSYTDAYMPLYDAIIRDQITKPLIQHPYETWVREADGYSLDLVSLAS